jgi:hypothetical protein
MNRVPAYGIPVLAVVLAMGRPALADPKPPAPGKQLVQALKNLYKAGNYRVQVSIEGGISDNAEHSITERTVSESYTGEVFRSQIMHVASLKAYRTPKKGVAFIQGSWRNILSAPEGVLLDRLFSFPEIILGRAAQYPRSATWVMDSDAAEEKTHSKEAGKEAREKSREPAEKSAQGKTVVVSSPKNAELSLPRLIRVEAPAQEALKHFLEVEKSGCISGG